MLGQWFLIFSQDQRKRKQEVIFTVLSLSFLLSYQFLMRVCKALSPFSQTSKEK